MKQGFDLLRMVSNVIESAEERVTKILRSFKEAIVRHILTRVVPDSFGRIQFRPVRWKLEDFQIATVRFEPGIGFLFFMMRSIILNQIDPVAASVEGGHDHLLQKRSEEHTSELQSRGHLVCRLLLEKKKNK